MVFIMFFTELPMNKDKDNTFIKDEYQAVSKIKKDYKTNPFEKYSGKISTSFGTLFLGIVLSVIGLVLLGYSEGIDNDLNIVRRSPLIHEQNLLRKSGMIKLTGTPVTNNPLTVPNFEEKLLYYEKVAEKKIEGEWKVINKHQIFAPFSIGQISVDASKAQLEFDLQEITKEETDDTRETIYGVLSKDDLVVVGSLKQNTISDGVVFVITNKSNKDLIDSMSSMGTIEWWLYKVGALLLMTLGFTAFILPILTFLDIFPNLGIGAISLILLFGFIIAALLVFISAIIITFWWLIFVIVGLVIIMLLRIKSKKKIKPISFIP